MNKQIYILALLILLAPACCKKRIKVQPMVATPVCQDVIVPVEGHAAIPITVPKDENVDAFALEEEENPFKAAMDSSQGEPELVSASGENLNSDITTDSTNYGLKTIYYDFNHYDIRPDQKSSLKHNLKIIKQLLDKGYDISIEGHACNFAGDTQYNIALSEDRAKGVADYLMSEGISNKRLHIIGHGSTRPLVPTGNKEQQAPNRRVEIYAYKDK